MKASLVVFASVILVGCGAPPRNAEQEQRARETIHGAGVRQHLLHDFDEEVGLLALKYSLDTIVVRRAVYSYLPAVDPMYDWVLRPSAAQRGARAIPVTARVTALVDSLAAENGIPKATLAALLLDVRTEHRMELAATPADAQE